jgi:hypothetical protein
MLWRDPAQDMKSIALSAILRCEPRPMSTSFDLPGQLSLASGTLARKEAGLLNAGLISHL